ncbi:MAG: hypothetical protein P8X91_00175 [Candidatus Bathyarchaeota archaeon]
MFDPKRLPIEIPIVPRFTIAKVATKSSGKEVENATSYAGCWTGRSN